MLCYCAWLSMTFPSRDRLGCQTRCTVGNGRPGASAGAARKGVPIKKLQTGTAKRALGVTKPVHPIVWQSRHLHTITATIYYLDIYCRTSIKVGLGTVHAVSCLILRRSVQRLPATKSPLTFSWVLAYTHPAPFSFIVCQPQRIGG